MASEKNEDYLIAHLLEETYQALPDRDESLQSPNLNEHFNYHDSLSVFNLDPTLENFLNRQAHTVTRLNYLPKIGCYRLTMGEKKIDIPGNWGHFSKLGRETSFSLLEMDEFNEILSQLYGKRMRSVLVGHFGYAQIAFFQEDDEFSLKWLNKYFEVDEKKEAA